MKLESTRELSDIDLCIDLCFDFVDNFVLVPRTKLSENNVLFLAIYTLYKWVLKHLKKGEEKLTLPLTDVYWHKVSKETSEKTRKMFCRMFLPEFVQEDVC